MSFSILGGSSVGVAHQVPHSEREPGRVSVSSADRVWVWRIPLAGHLPAAARFSILGGSSVGVARRCRDVPVRWAVVSVSSADRVWVWLPIVCIVHSFHSKFQYPRRIECGCGLSAYSSVSSASRIVSVSSADRVWVWRSECQRHRLTLTGFSILGGSSVGVAFS